MKNTFNLFIHILGNLYHLIFTSTVCRLCMHGSDPWNACCKSLTDWMLKNWQARDEASKAALKSRKQTIQRKFREEMGLLVDIVKQG